MTEPSGVVQVFDEAAGSYDRVGVDFFEPFGAEVVRRAGLRAGERVLDVGCGRGAVLFPAAQAVGPHGHVTGVDAAVTMVALTRDDVRRAGLRQVSVEVGDAQAPGFAPGSFDAVTAGLVVFLLPDPPAALRNYVRLLRPGGRLAMSTFGAHDPNFLAALQALARHLPADAPRPAGADGPFGTEESTRHALTAAGFAGVDITEVRVCSRFDDEEHWLAWCWSHGARALLRAIPADRLPAATADAYSAIRGARAAGDGLAITTTVRVAVAGVGGG